MATFRGVVKQCERCGKEIRLSPSRAAQGIRTCSRECGYAIRRVANKVPGVEVQCELCGKRETLPPSLAAKYRFCSRTCQHKSPVFKAEKSARMVGSSNPRFTGEGRVSISASGVRYRRQSKAAETARILRRKVAKLRAIPAWANFGKIARFYTEAQRLTELLGERYEVDHIVPLQSRVVCGLHNEFNLQVLPAALNKSKSNRFWPDQ